MGVLLDLALEVARPTEEARSAAKHISEATAPVLVPPSIALSPTERAALDRLAAAWGMDEDDRAAMFRQCERGGELADGSWISPEDARAFWLGEAGAIH